MSTGPPRSDHLLKAPPLNDKLLGHFLDLNYNNYVDCYLGKSGVNKETERLCKRLKLMFRWERIHHSPLFQNSRNVEAERLRSFDQLEMPEPGNYN